MSQKIVDNFQLEKLLVEITDPNKFQTLTKGLIVEKKMDSVVRILVRDIIKILKKGKEGEFELPSDINGEQLYSFTHFANDFNLELNITYNKKDKVDMDANYYSEEDVIVVDIEINPEKIHSLLQSIIGPLNEMLVHELVHIKQHERGDEFPNEEPEKSLDYYLQNHELEAQFRGFKRRAKQEKRSLDSIMDEWFKENKEKHHLTKKEIQKLKKAIENWNG